MTTSAIISILSFDLIRIVSVPGMRQVRLDELRQLLLSRGYKAGELQKTIEWDMELERDAVIDKVVRNDDKNKGRVKYTITFDPKLPKISSILSRNWKVMVQTDERLVNAFTKPPMACLRRGPNLQDELVTERPSS